MVLIEFAHKIKFYAAIFIINGFTPTIVALWLFIRLPGFNIMGNLLYVMANKINLF